MTDKQVGRNYISYYVKYGLIQCNFFFLKNNTVSEIKHNIQFRNVQVLLNNINSENNTTLKLGHVIVLNMFVRKTK